MNEYPGRVLQDVRNTSFASFLDFARWSAASIVFLGHLRDPLFLGYGDVPPDDRNVAVLVWYFVTGWFGEAVIVFFVLSGFLVGGLAAARFREGKFSLTDYAIDRVTRLYVAFLPALTLTALLDFAATHWLPDIGFYTHLHPMIAQKVNAAPYLQNMTPSSFLLNMFMLQTVEVPSFGSNDPLWTISLEFWFYVIFGVLISAAAATKRWRFLGVAVACALFVLLGNQFPLYLGLWLCGVAAAFAPWRRAERPLIAAMAFFGLLMATRMGQGFFKQGAYGFFIRDYLVAIAFSWLLVSMRSVHWIFLVKSSSVNRFMADFSYSLYLIHFPMMLFLLTTLYATGRFDLIARGYEPTNAKGLLVYALVIASIYFSAWLFSQGTERQTWKARQLLKRVLVNRSINHFKNRAKTP